MQILVPLKPVVLVWGLLSGMILVGFIASSLLEGKDPFAPGATIMQPTDVKIGASRSGGERGYRICPTPNRNRCAHRTARFAGRVSRFLHARTRSDNYSPL
jgi:hypothetical protein